MLKLRGAKHDDSKQKVEEVKIRRLNQVESTHSQGKKISKLRMYLNLLLLMNAYSNYF